MTEQQLVTFEPYDRDAWSKPPSGSAWTPETPWRSLIFLAAAVLIVGGGFGYWAYRHQQVVMGMDPAVEVEGREYMASLLRDPSSAQFRNTKIQNECFTGEINGKTGFGGYAGFQEFYYIRSKKKGAIKPEEDAAMKAVNPYKELLIHLEYSEGVSACMEAGVFKKAGER